MAIFAVQYSYSDDSAARDEHRAAHQAFLGGLADEGMVLFGGPYADDGFPGALLVLQAAHADGVRTVLRDDPFQQQGLVEEVQVREWELLLGSAVDVALGH